MMEILVADKVSSQVIAGLEAAGGNVVYKPDVTAEALPTEVGDAAVLIVRSTKVTSETIAAGKALRLIVRAGAGVDTIALDAASDRGVLVANCPGANTAAVAELAIGLLIAADRRIPDATAALRRGEWLKAEFGKSAGLKGRVLGIVGTGPIGRATAVRAQALGMRVVAWSRSLTPAKAEEQGMECAADLLSLAATADAVSVHLASTPETKSLLGKAFFDALKPGAIFVNTARGNVVDTEALRAAIETKGVRAGLDVFEKEPAGGKAEFAATELAARIAAGTPHIGASTDQASEAIAAEALRIVTEFMRTGQADNVVNLRPPVKDKVQLLVRHYNRVGVLARILTAVRDQGINVEEMHDTAFQTGTAACCRLVLDREPTAATLARIRADESVIAVG